MTERDRRTRDEIGCLFEELSLEQFRVAVDSLLFLVDQLGGAVGLPEPYYIVPDNSLLQDLRRGAEQERRLPRSVAIRGLAYFIKNYIKLDARVVITPTIFFESIGMRELRDKAQYQNILRQFKIDLEPFGLPIMLSGIAGYREARKLGSLILRDARQIIKILRDIKESQWDICLQEGSHKYPITIPAAKAQELLLPKIKLRYFREWYVRFILGGIIEKAIVESHANSKEIRQMFGNKDHLISSSLLKIKKDQIKGLGDIEIFQYCDIRSQFLSKTPYTCVGLTFDRNLAETLRIHSNLIIRSEGMTGEDDENAFMKKWQSWGNDLQRFADFDRAQETFQSNYCDFLDDIKPVLVSLEDKLQA